MINSNKSLREIKRNSKKIGKKSCMRSEMISPKTKLFVIQNIIFINKSVKSVIYKLLQDFIENEEQWNGSVVIHTSDQVLFVWTGITLANLNWSDTHPLVKEILKINSKGNDMQVFNGFSRHTGMLKGPEALDNNGRQKQLRHF